MKQLWTALILGLALLTLGACTAIQQAGGGSVPITQPTRLSETTVLPGQTVDVRYIYPRSVFEDASEFAGRFDTLSLDYASVRRPGDRVPDVSREASWLTLKSVEAPSGVSVTLLQADIGRVVTQTQVSGAKVSVRYREEFRLLYRVSVARGFRPASMPENAYATLTFTDGRRSFGTRLYLKFSP